MTFNIRRDVDKDGANNWQYRKASIIKMIHEHAPDIICMQEVMPHMAKYLVQELSCCYGHTSLECITNGALSKTFFVWGEGMITFFRKDKFKLIGSDYTKLFDKRWFNARRALFATLSDGKNQLTVVNTHFCHLDGECRKQSFEKLLNWVDENKLTNVFIAGDFNTEIHYANNGIDLFTNRFSYNIPDSEGTFNSYGGIKGVTIDFIFSDRPIVTTEVIRSEYDIKYISDHYPVVNVYAKLS